ncbi:alpha/beta fold hydrolase [Archangium violaceum]|uniref:alpha/beta hydrolase n=1 Tax=Archangium violaceum TaxID=83451 RepID=UPI00193BFEFD|nr:alpha/beta hydrolase [Archangium violaceum]QRK10135.1 alpha/beta fold hydrolase [Archangium violaceum]
MRKHVARILPAVLSGLLSLSACTRGVAQEPVRKVALTPCRLEGAGRQGLCGTYEVWEDRAAKKGRKVPLKVVVVPALAASPEPDPLVLLAGGPGQGAAKLAGQMVPLLERVQRNRDLVFVDQRGTGDSRPLECEPVPPDAPLAQQFDDAFFEEAFRKCLAGYDADVRLYTTPIAMDDLDEVREALGYQKLNLYGVSYGTRAALVYLRQHPEHVRSAILEGVAPMSLLLPLYVARDSQRALDLLFTHCEQDAACTKRYPELRGRFASLLAQLRKEPVRSRVEHPLTGVPEDITLTYDGLTAVLRGLLYMPEAASLVPLVLDRATQGDWRSLVAIHQSMTGSYDRNLSQGMFFSVVCSEDMPFISDEAITRETKGTWLGEEGVRKMLAPCAFWPRGELARDYREPVKSDVPVLLLSGELDPVTPPSWAEDAKRTLSNSLHVVLPGVGHGTSAIGCARSLMADFVTRGSVEGLEPKCGEGLKRPPFFTSFAGPVP